MSLTDEIRSTKNLPAPATARMIRVTAGVSQARMAEELGVHRMTVVRWERGSRRPRGAARVRYAELLRDIQREMAS